MRLSAHCRRLTSCAYLHLQTKSRGCPHAISFNSTLYPHTTLAHGSLPRRATRMPSGWRRTRCALLASPMERPTTKEICARPSGESVDAPPQSTYGNKAYPKEASQVAAWRPISRTPPALPWWAPTSGYSWGSLSEADVCMATL